MYIDHLYLINDWYFRVFFIRRVQLAPVFSHKLIFLLILMILLILLMCVSIDSDISNSVLKTVFMVHKHQSLRYKMRELKKRNLQTIMD